MRRKVKVIRIPKKYIDAVNRGVKWLDVTLGRKVWLKRMDMTLFDIEDSNTCVAGNVFKDVFIKSNSAFDTAEDGYDRFIEIMDAVGAKDSRSKAIEFGFNADGERGMQYLQDIWVRKIKRLKASAKIR